MEGARAETYGRDRRTARIGAVVALALACVVTASPLHAQALERNRVVILHSGETSLPAMATLDASLREAIRAGRDRPVEFYPEALDKFRFPQPELEVAQVDYLRHKYGRLSVGLVVAIAERAREFAERHRAEIWPGAPLLYFGVQQETGDSERAADDAVGFFIRLDAGATLDLALRLQPSVRRVVLVGGSSAEDRRWNELAERTVAARPERLELRRWTDLDLATLRERVSRLRPDTLVIFTTLLRDASGRHFVPQDVLRDLSARSRAPFYGFFASYVGAGVVGGVVPSFEEHGRLAGEIAVRMMAGEPASEIALEVSPPPVCRADWTQLERLGLDAARLPADCEILDRPPSLWSEHRTAVLVGAAVIGAQGMLLAALLVQWRRRRLAEREAESRRADLVHASRLALAGELTASIAHEINQPLGAILANAAAAQMILERDPSRTAEVCQILSDIRDDDRRASEVIRHLRTLLSRREMERVEVEVNAVVRGVLALVERDATRRGVEIAIELAPLPPVRGDAVHLEQVVLNLVLNAFESMADTPAGQRRVTLRTEEAGDGVEISIEDSGPGFAPDQLDRLFEAYFTTKRHGMGLGLAIARFIVEAHGGRIGAAQAEAGGALFRIVLPAMRRAVAKKGVRRELDAAAILSTGLGRSG